MGRASFRRSCSGNPVTVSRTFWRKEGRTGDTSTSLSPNVEVAMQRLLRLAVCALVLSSCGGGSGNPPPGGGGGGPGFRATIEGQAWQAESIGSSAAAVPGVPGSLVIVGAQTSG